MEESSEEVVEVLEAEPNDGGSDLVIEGDELGGCFFCFLGVLWRRNCLGVMDFKSCFMVTADVAVERESGRKERRERKCRRWRGMRGKRREDEGD